MDERDLPVADHDSARCLHAVAHGVTVPGGEFRRGRASACMTRALAAGLACLLLMALPARAGTAPATLPLVQGWADTGQISVDDDWSRVAGIVGYRGDGLVAEPGSDPRGVTADGSARRWTWRRT